MVPPFPIHRVKRNFTGITKTRRYARLYGTMNITYAEAILDKLVGSLQHAAQKIDHLEACGYSHTFRRTGNNILCLQTKREYAPTDLKIEEFHEVQIDNNNSYYIFALRKPGSLLRGILTECPPPDTDETIPE